MAKTSHPSHRWIIEGIDPDGPLVRHIREIADREHMTVAAWLERWLDLVLRHHYGNPDPDASGQGGEVGLATVQADMRRKLASVTKSLGDLYQTVERTHHQVEAIEEEVRSTEAQIHPRAKGQLPGAESIPGPRKPSK